MAPPVVGDAVSAYSPSMNNRNRLLDWVRRVAIAVVLYTLSFGPVCAFGSAFLNADCRMGLIIAYLPFFILIDRKGPGGGALLCYLRAWGAHV
jgi:hypothetical protein